MVCCIIISVKGKRPEVIFKEVLIMYYNIYVNGECVNTLYSIMDVVDYVNCLGLFIVEENENREVNNCYVDLICEEA